MRPTSIDAWNEVQGALPAARRKVLNVVAEWPGRTGRELERMTGDRKANARLSELEAQGLVEARGTRVCDVTGMRSLMWWWTRSYEVRPLPVRRGKTKKELVERIEMLEILLASTGRELL